MIANNRKGKGTTTCLACFSEIMIVVVVFVPLVVVVGYVGS